MTCHMMTQANGRHRHQLPLYSWNHGSEVGGWAPNHLTWTQYEVLPSHTKVSSGAMNTYRLKIGIPAALLCFFYCKCDANLCHPSIHLHVFFSTWYLIRIVTNWLYWLDLSWLTQIPPITKLIASSSEAVTLGPKIRVAKVLWCFVVNQLGNA